MSVEIDPQELAFQRPFTQEVSQTLKIRNPNHTPIAFKVRGSLDLLEALKLLTTMESTGQNYRPKAVRPTRSRASQVPSVNKVSRYCVRPNSGRVEPGKEVEVTGMCTYMRIFARRVIRVLTGCPVVLLQAMKQEPPLEAKCRDKFLVQSVAITADKEFDDTASIWQHVDAAEKSSVQEKKIRVVYLAPASPSGGAVTPMRNGVNGESNGANETSSIAPPQYGNARSPSPEATYTPETSRRSLAPSVVPTSKLEDEPSNAKSLGDAKASAFNPASGKSSVGGAATVGSTVAAAVPLSYDELKAQLADAKATISSYGNEAGLRMRKVAAGETSNATVNDVAHRVQASQGGVPLQIVAALCLLSFLLAYAFF
ncbi:hypothetical protein HYALB_00008534 [Hymenoscyphus albidus]|uniref:MSP domain-containing protein n=1 Tax=Hymenoscyphus albidus TaxID=595503 RepID=A0A9N9Q600_9HELO|nr:hypothetical protein HYALB_00008534 [Hymenoscyphus albidus]